MNPIVLKILFTIVIEGFKLLRRYYGSLTPEQRAELEAATEESFEHAGSMGSGVGEGALPETPGIVLMDAIDPKAHVDDKVGG